MGQPIHIFIYWLFPLLLSAAAVFDLMTMTIPNKLCGLICAIFVAASLAVGLPWAAMAFGLAAAATVLVAGFICFSFGWMGGGDAKLAAAAALWLGFGQLLPFLCYVAVIGGLLTVLLLAFRGRILPAFAMRLDWVARLHDRDSGIPYGIAIAAAALMAFPETPFLQLALN